MSALGLLARYGLTKPAVGPPPTGISFVGATTGQQNVSSPDRSVDKPNGVTDGDLLLVLIGGTYNGYALAITPPIGWTQLEHIVYVPSGGAGSRMELFVKTAGASEPSAYTFNVNTNNASVSWVGVAYRGAKIADSASTYRTAFNSNPLATPAVDVPLNGYWAGGWSAFNAGRTLTPEAGLNDRVKEINLVAWSDLAIPLGALGVTKQATPDGNSRMSAFGVALEPA